MCTIWCFLHHLYQHFITTFSDASKCSFPHCKLSSYCVGHCFDLCSHWPSAWLLMLIFHYFTLLSVWLHQLKSCLLPSLSTFLSVYHFSFQILHVAIYKSFLAFFHHDAQYTYLPGNKKKVIKIMIL